jgi:hypothetical protein
VDAMKSEPRQFVGKMRRWHAYLSVAVSDPANRSSTSFADMPKVMRPKVLATLMCTIPDVTYLAEH